MPQRPTQSNDYWETDFAITQADIDHLYGIMLDTETPLSADEMALMIVRYRVDEDEVVETSPSVAVGNEFYPTQKYHVGDELTFPIHGGTVGKVQEIRDGDNADYGDYSVLTVELEDGRQVHFAAGVAAEYLTTEEVEEPDEPEQEVRLPEELFIDYGGLVARALESRMGEHEDLIRIAGRWFPRSLLANVNIGHLNLAEAILDMNAGGPMHTNDILDQAGMMGGVHDLLAEFSMNYGLQEDERFDEVGPAGQVLWYLKRLEPEGVLEAPKGLDYSRIDYDASAIQTELRELEQLIGDEHSAADVPSGKVASSVTVTLIYPHWRAGTLPLSAALARLFPTAYEAPRIRFTLIDEASGDEFPAWVVRPFGYVYGLGALFEKYEVPVGTYVTVERTDDPSRVSLKMDTRRARKEWVRTARIENNRLRFENLQRSIGVSYDDLMIVHLDDADRLDEYREGLAKRRLPLEKMMEDAVRSLSDLSTQGHVHAKTIYSVVNLMRRVPPGPIFATLETDPTFVHAGGAYWRLSGSDSE